MKIQAPALVAAATLRLSNAQKIFDLASYEWTLSAPTLNITVPGSVPSHVHLDLLNADAIPDPYYGMNDFELRWIAQNNWTYSAEIHDLNLTDLTDDSSTWLVFNGLDTYTDIRFCDQHVASTNNQFRQFYFDVSTILDSCANDHPRLSIEFGSAQKITERIAELPGQETWPSGVNMLYEIPNRHFVRKEQSDFGWDWGPAFAPAGIWQPAYIVQLSVDSSPGFHVRNSLLDIYREGQLNSLPPDQSAPWVLNASLDYFSSGPLPKSASLTYAVADSEGSIVSQGALVNITSTDSTISGATVLDPSSFDLWWPRGLGPQNLYNVTINLVADSGSALATVEKRTGFRTIVLNQGEVTPEQISKGVAPGGNFHFEVNGQEFYAKGSNFIPPDVFWPRVTHEQMVQLFDSVIDGNQNMLRVWSSGAYTPDFIFDIADATGILLWSEFEFGCSLYPVDQPFLDNVADEAYYNVRRSNHHPSLAMWAGGNEMENLILPLAKQADPKNYGKYLAEYETLFLDVLLHQVYQNTRSISYTPSSSGNGYLSLDHSRPNPIIERYDNTTEGHVYGDTDYYNYDAKVAFDTSEYPIGRFANEFGFHSMPSLQTWRSAIPPEDLTFNSSTIVLGHNRHPPPGGLNTTDYDNSIQGMIEMTAAAELYYPAPNKKDSIANFAAWCWTTQVFQADYYRSQIQFYRRGSGLPNRQLGSLYWQLEDQWQGPTWSSIEYNGRWKVLHYGAKDVYQPVIVSPFYDATTGDLSVWVTSDLWSTTTGTAHFEWYDWSGKPLTNISIPASKPFEVGALNTTQVYQAGLHNSTLDLNNAVLYMNITAQGVLPNNQGDEPITFNHENFFHANPLSKAELVDPGITVSYSEETGNFTVSASQGIAAWTWLDYANTDDIITKTIVNFDTNGFWLLPGRERQVGFRVKRDETDGEWVRDVTVQSIWNNTLAE